MIGQWQKITDRFLSVIWLFENVFWKYANNIAYKQDREKIKRVLKQVYWYEDIDKLFPAEVDQNSVDRVMRTIFTYHDPWLDWEQKGIFNKKNKDV